jgi:hypothetical protein
MVPDRRNNAGFSCRRQPIRRRNGYAEGAGGSAHGAADGDERRLDAPGDCDAQRVRCA